jgi:type III pantothenate kinase
MTILLVDIGNTRVKWALLRGAVPGPMRAVLHGGDGKVLSALVRRAPRDVERVIAVNVAGSKLGRALDAAVRQRFGVRPEYIRSTRSAHGVRNRYRDTWRLGADRWVGVIAAHALARGRAVLVANVGTALTIDAVTAKGAHLGGAIVPGPAAMIESLLRGTHGIRRRVRGSSPPVRTLFAADTASALAAGATFATAAFIDRALAEATRTLRARPLLLLTGGAAPALRRHLKSPARVVPDLVLRGLAVFARP